MGISLARQTLERTRENWAEMRRLRGDWRPYFNPCAPSWALSTLPPIMFSEDISRFRYTNPTGHLSGLCISRIVSECFCLGLPNVRWYDSSEMVYIRSPFESHSANTYFTHSMAFGGGGIAICYPLAQAISEIQDECLEHYPMLYSSDDRLHACIAELGWDIRGNAHVLLSTHSIAPFVSIHHIEAVGPFYPGLSSLESLKLFTKAMKIDPKSFLQRSICCDHVWRVTFSVSLGYVVQVHPYIVLPRELERAEQTYSAWNKISHPNEFNFDTRLTHRSVCKNPVIFYLKDAWKEGNATAGSYLWAKGSDGLKRRVLCFPRSPPLPHVQNISVVGYPLSKNWHVVPRRLYCKVNQANDGVLTLTVWQCERGAFNSIFFLLYEWQMGRSEHLLHLSLITLSGSNGCIAANLNDRGLMCCKKKAQTLKEGYDHNKKAGAMNALVRTSAITSNGPFILNLDCDHYIYNSATLREGMCFLLDRGGDRICYVQSPQRFEGIDPNDRYVNHNTAAAYSGELRYMVLVLQEPQNIMGGLRSNLFFSPRRFGNSTTVVASIPKAEYQGRLLQELQGKGSHGRPAGSLAVPNRLHQVLRWATGSEEIFFSKNNALFASPRMKFLQRIAYFNVEMCPFTSIFILVFLLLITVTLCLLAILEIKWSGITLHDWWRNEQFWLIAGTSAYPAVVLQGILNVIAGVDISFTLTSKSATPEEGDDEFADLYLVKWSFLMLAPSTIMMVNMSAIAVGGGKKPCMAHSHSGASLLEEYSLASGCCVISTRLQRD
ncbi:hypothetical protein IFM89_005629 [Coptis chinensis]|uniref:Uncharacterized protein n=1 Tax=Coptis chinensis TaxID=261450 RepID=A0A835HVZ8_9MAGN|nr:hypothetical protein IFM89_005629 [Coptis chinensis]